MADPRAPALLRLPQLVGRDAEWASIQVALGLTFPASFVALIDAFGASTWNDFLFVPSPLSANYREWVDRKLDAERTSRTAFPEHYPLALFPETGGLYPWAVSDNGDVFFWLTRGDHSTWPTIIKDARAPEFEAHFSPSNIILHHVATGRLRSAILPDDL